MFFCFQMQIDVSVIPFMEDSMLSAYIPLLGDRIAVRQFCRQHNRQAAQGSRQQGSSRRNLLLEQLREKLKKRRTSDEEHSSNEDDQPTETTKKPKNVGNRNARKSTRTVTVGWRNITAGGHLMQVRASSGGGTRNIRLPLTATKTDILSEAKKLFFTSGTSCRGCIADFKFDVVDFRYQVVEDGLTIKSMYETVKPAGNLRFYMTTARLSDTSLQLDSSPASVVCFFTTMLHLCSEFCRGFLQCYTLLKYPVTTAI